MDETQQRELARGLREGRTEAWNALYDAYAAPVWQAVARLMGPGSSDVADVVQETFLAAARSAGSYDPSRGPLWLWLLGVARKHVAIHYRKQARADRIHHAAEWLAEVHPQVMRWLENREEQPPDALAAAELSTLVRAALTELPEDYAALLAAKYLDGESVDAIAATHRCSSAAIRSKLARAREAFRGAFARFYPCPRGVD